jgi:predicted small integral membrane protein
MNLGWMYWTPITAGFFIVIGLMVAGMTVWDIVAPSVERRGFLPIPTTRGDRFFIGLLGSAYINIAWVGLTHWSLWFALPISIVWIVIVMRFG